MIGIIDYNMGNLASVYNACHLLDAKASIVKDPNELKKFDRVILPGVGAVCVVMYVYVSVCGWSCVCVCGFVCVCVCV